MNGFPDMQRGRGGGGYCDLPGKAWWVAGKDTLSGALERINCEGASR